jgi:uncharacterized protein (TIGR03437 family)
VKIRLVSITLLSLVVWNLTEWRQLNSHAQITDRPRALAAADFDEDGTPDLISSYAIDNGGVLKFQRGNVAAVYPHSRAAQTQFSKTNEPFFAPAHAATLPLSPDFLAAGDFNADGHWDIVAAQRGAAHLIWLPGDGHGGFGAPQSVALPGAVTVMRGGEINRPDGLTDLAVGIATPAVARLLIFEGPDGALQHEPENLPLPAAARDVALGSLDNNFGCDIAVATDQRLVLISGRDRKLSLDKEQQASVPAAQLEERSFNATLQALATGHFTEHRQEELAVYLNDGTLVALSPASAEALSEWQVAELKHAPSQLARKSDLPLQMISLHSAAAPFDQLVLLAPDVPLQSLTDLADVSINASQAVSALPLRLNTDALSDLVILSNQGLSFALTTPAATFTVTNNNDSGAGSLRQAMLDANARIGLDMIAFNLPAGARTITPATTLPPLTDAVVIDGTTQPGFTGAPLVEINGERAEGSCLLLQGGDSTVRGLVINRCKRSAIESDSKTGYRVEGCYIGTNLTGTQARGNYTGAIISSGAAVAVNGIIGGTTDAARNIISGNMQSGVSGGTVIQGNYIGVDVTGKKALSNPSGGVSASNGLIGGTSAGSGNIISGNSSNPNTPGGIGAGDNVLVQGNLVGLDATGLTGIPGQGNGIITSGSNNLIGGTTPAARNIISANANYGVWIANSFPRGNRIQGNYIGTDLSGTKAFGNSFYGIIVLAGETTIGGTAAGARNVIAANQTGMDVRGANSIVQGNFIGTDATGNKGLGNESGLSFTTTDCVIGGTEAGARNVIAANRFDGLTLASSRFRIQNNLIGLFADLTPAGNGRHGILLSSSRTMLIGGDSEQAANVIANNGGSGIALVAVFPGSVGNTFQRNAIYNNSLFGIDLGNDGVTPNDAGDADTGANDLLNSPLLLAATTSATNTVMRGAMQCKASAAYTLEFYANPQCDASGQGQGRTYLGSATVNTDASGNAPINVTLPTVVTANQFITATATDAAGNTSEFSPCTPVNSNALRLSLAAQPLQIGLGGNVTYTLTLINSGSAAATDVVVTDTLSAALTVTDCAATNGGACSGTGMQRSIRFASVPANSAVTITLKATTNCELLNTQAVTHSAAITSVAGNPPAATSTVSFVASVLPSTRFPQASYDVGSAGGGVLIQVQGPTTCRWTAVSQSNFITIASGSSGQGTANVVIQLAENTAPTRRSGSVLIAGATLPINQSGRVSAVSAASYSGATLAAESIVALFGEGLSTQTLAASTTPLPTDVEGIFVEIFERNPPFTSRRAPLFYVSPQQINFQIPKGTASGRADITVRTATQIFSDGFILVTATAPGLFAANANGQGVAAALILRVKPDGTQSYQPVAAYDTVRNQYVALPLDLGPASDQVFLVLFGTGIRARSALQAVTAKLGGTDAEVLFAGAQGDLVGLDQINLRLPGSLAGRGLINIELTADDNRSNVVQINIK